MDRLDWGSIPHSIRTIIKRKKKSPFHYDHMDQLRWIGILFHQIRILSSIVVGKEDFTIKNILSLNIRSGPGGPWCGLALLLVHRGDQTGQRVHDPKIRRVGLSLAKSIWRLPLIGLIRMNGEEEGSWVTCSPGPQRHGRTCLPVSSATTTLWLKKQLSGITKLIKFN